MCNENFLHYTIKHYTNITRYTLNVTQNYI